MSWVPTCFTSVLASNGQIQLLWSGLQPSLRPDLRQVLNRKKSQTWSAIFFTKPGRKPGRRSGIWALAISSSGSSLMVIVIINVELVYIEVVAVVVWLTLSYYCSVHPAQSYCDTQTFFWKKISILCIGRSQTFLYHYVTPTLKAQKLGVSVFFCVVKPIYHNCDSTTIRLRYDYDEKLTRSFFACVELEAGGLDTS